MTAGGQTFCSDLLALWQTRVADGDIPRTIIELSVIRDRCHASSSRTDIDLLIDALCDVPGTPAEASMWGELINGWAWGFPAPHLYPSWRYPLPSTPERTIA